jgi:hypothetical protein
MKISKDFVIRMLVERQGCDNGSVCPGSLTEGGRLGIVDLIKMGCFEKEKKNIV